MAQSAAGGANRTRNFAGNGDIGSVQINVVGDQKFADANRGCARRGVQARFADVRRTVWIAQSVFAQALKLTFADIFQIHTLGASRCGFIKVNRDAVALPQFPSHAARERHALFHRNTRERNEGNNVGRADARMHAGLSASDR